MDTRYPVQETEEKLEERLRVVHTLEAKGVGVLIATHASVLAGGQVQAARVAPLVPTLSTPVAGSLPLRTTWTVMPCSSPEKTSSGQGAGKGEGSRASPNAAMNGSLSASPFHTTTKPSTDPDATTNAPSRELVTSRHDTMLLCT